MQRDGLPAAASRSWIARAFGTGTLPPPRFSLTLRPGPRGEPPPGIEWAVRSFVLEEALDIAYTLELVAIASTADFDLNGLLGVRVELEIGRAEATRTVHGVVLRAELRGDHGDGHRVWLRVGPALALAGLGRHSRVFQGHSVVEIVDTVLHAQLPPRGSMLVLDRLERSYAPRDFCVQYRESDLDFVLRILADEGITVVFDHDGEAERVVLIDEGGALPFAGAEPLAEPVEGPPALPLVPDDADEVPTESVQQASVARGVTRDRWVASGWDWQSRPPVLTRTVHEQQDRDVGITWVEVDEGRPGEGEDGDGPLDDASDLRASRQCQRDLQGAVRLTATTNATILRAGSVFELAGPAHDDYGDTWVVTRIRHEADVPEASVHGSPEAEAPQYRNTIVCRPSTVPPLPAVRPRPEARGTHTAVVTGPAGQTIHTDRFGRIRVRMLWDTLAHEDTHTSCWLRVAQPWAGDGFGTVFIPRVGAEVLVSFIDGDPDRPLCTGSVYSGGTLPPYALPEHATRTVLRTESTDGDGYNELSFEDAAGQEEVFLHAERNLREVIKAHHTTSVGGGQRSYISGSRTAAVGKDDLLHVSGDGTCIVDGDRTDRVHGAMRLHVSKAPKGTSGLGVVVEQGTIDMEAAQAIVLRCGASRLEIHPRKIVLSGPEIVAQCPSQTATHPTSMVLTEGGIETNADQLRGRTADARLEADTQVVLGTGPQMGRTMLSLVDDDATLRAAKAIEVRGTTVTAAGSETMHIKGSTCEVGGQVVSVRGNRVGIDADARIGINTPGQVNVIGREKITLN
ncbi:MAG: type VI secretion system tip protein TssI/VgrG [Nannocystaceae bacterium]